MRGTVAIRGAMCGIATWGAARGAEKRGAGGAAKREAAEAGKRGKAGAAKCGTTGAADRGAMGAPKRGAAKRGAAGAAKRGTAGAAKRGAAGAARMPPKPPGRPSVGAAVPATARATIVAMQKLHCHTPPTPTCPPELNLVYLFLLARASPRAWEKSHR